MLEATGYPRRTRIRVEVAFTAIYKNFNTPFTFESTLIRFLPN